VSVYYCSTYYKAVRVKGATAGGEGEGEQNTGEGEDMGERVGREIEGSQGRRQSTEAHSNRKGTWNPRVQVGASLSLSLGHVHVVCEYTSANARACESACVRFRYKKDIMQ
jgi:hypothetical protein